MSWFSVMEDGAEEKAASGENSGAAGSGGLFLGQGNALVSDADADTPDKSKSSMLCKTLLILILLSY